MEEREKSSQSDGKGNFLRLCAALIKTPDSVVNLTTRTKLSVPLTTRTMRPNGHCDGAILSSVMKSTSPIIKLLSFLLHFFHSSNHVTYSLLQRFQKCGSTFLISAHLVVPVHLVMSDFFRVSLVGKVSSFAPPIRCAGVNTSSSFGSTEKMLNGREFKTTLN